MPKTTRINAKDSSPKIYSGYCQRVERLYIPTGSGSESRKAEPCPKGLEMKRLSFCTLGRGFRSQMQICRGGQVITGIDCQMLPESEKGEERHDEIERKGYPELGERNEENVTMASLIRIST